MIFIQIRRWLRTKALSLALVIITMGLLLFPIVPVSEKSILQNWLLPSAHANVIRDLLVRTGLYNPPRQGTAPTGRRSGGAGRGQICALLEGSPPGESVKALMPYQAVETQANQLEAQGPDSGTGNELVGGLTVEPQPTFWFYVPYVSAAEFPAREKRVARFVLLDEADRPVWNELIAFELRDRPQLVEYSLPYELKTENLYKWYFSIICDPEKRSRNPVVRGWVQRVEAPPGLEMALKVTSPIAWHEVYAENGIWLEMVSALVNARRNFPLAGGEDWSTLMAYLNIPDPSQLTPLDPAVAVDREVVVSGNQFPARM